MLGSQLLLADGERPAIERLGLGQALFGAQQPTEIVQAGGDIRMLRTGALLVDGERAAIERLGFS